LKEKGKKDSILAKLKANAKAKLDKNAKEEKMKKVELVKIEESEAKDDGRSVSEIYNNDYLNQLETDE